MRSPELRESPLFVRPWQDCDVLSYEDLAGLWGSSAIERAGQSALDGVTVPDDAAQVLTQIGLPRRVVPLFEIRPLSMVAVAGREEGFCEFGSDIGTELCISSVTGEVISTSRAGEYPQRFVNRSLRQFIEFLYLVSVERRRFPDIGDEDIELAIDGLESRLRRVDEDALEAPDNWWAVVVEQLHDGLL